MSTTAPATRGATAATAGPTLADRLRRLQPLFGHEWTLAALAAVLLSLLLNAGAFADPTHTLPKDVWDPSFEAYVIAWDGYALLHNPAGIWDLNSFYPSPDGLAYSDSMLGYAPFAIIGTGPEAALLRYNLIFIGAQALIFFGGYVLARQLGLRPIAATLVGIALGVAPWRGSQTGHLHVISAGGMFLALAMLARGHGIRWLRRPGEPVPYRPGWALAGWLVAAWQLSIGFGIGIPFLYVLLGATVFGVLAWAVRTRSHLRRGDFRTALPPRRLLVASVCGGVIFAGIALLLALPYLHVLELYPQFKRGVAWVELFSPPVTGLFIAPAESLQWGDAQTATRDAMGSAGEKSLLPGFVLYLLAAGGLFRSVWSLRVRLGLGVGALAVLVLSLGTNGPNDGEAGYLLLMNLPGFEGIRTPGRLIVWATLLLGLLAAGLVGALAESAWAAAARRDARRPLLPQVADFLGSRRSLWHGAFQAAVLIPTLLVFLEGRSTLEHARVEPTPPSLASVPAPYLVLPTGDPIDMTYMLWSTDGFPALANGGGPAPTELAEIREAAKTFPDQASVEVLRRYGIRSVVVVNGRAGWITEGPLAQVGAAYVPIDGLGLTRQVHADIVVFLIN